MLETELFGVALGRRSIDGWVGKTFMREGNVVVAGGTRYAAYSADKERLLGTEDGVLPLLDLGFTIGAAYFEPHLDDGCFICAHVF